MGEGDDEDEGTLQSADAELQMQIDAGGDPAGRQARAGELLPESLQPAAAHVVAVPCNPHTLPARLDDFSRLFPPTPHPPAVAPASLI